MPSVKSRYCSGCKRTHDFGRPCRACFKRRCPFCRTWNEVDSGQCWNCRATLAMTPKMIRRTTHPDGMNRCPIEGCGTMLRIQQRDKRRAHGKKKKRVRRSVGP